MFGVARPPAAGAALHGLTEGDMVAWRYAEQADTVEYRYTRGSPSSLLAEVRRAGAVVGRAQATFDSGGALRNATLMVPSVPARLDLTFQSTTRTTFEPTVWRGRDP